MIHLLNHLLGGDGGEFASLWGGIIGDFGLFVGLYVLYRKHNCHQPGCLRIGKRPLGDSGIIVCHKHHPDGRITRTHMARARAEHLRKHSHTEGE